MTVIVAGTFRLPREQVVEARDEMTRVIAASLAEIGCRSYSYAEDICEAGLFRVHEEWDSRAALDAHLATPHMERWQDERDKLGFYDRRISVYEVASVAPL